MDLADVECTMLAEYAEAGMPSWPSPRRIGDVPADDEYSRVTDPERYAVVHARAAAWASALAGLPDVSVSRDGDLLRVSSSRARTAPLHLALRTVLATDDAGPIAFLDVALGDPGHLLATWPDCGCDACDCGSDDLLEAVDDAIRSAIGGPVVILTGPTWEARWSTWQSGTSGLDAPPFDDLMETCRLLADGSAPALPDDAEAFVSQSWLDEQ
ncbi:DUF6226 family protein [Nocardioides jejuensis]|uniref:Uncharacterized protein n=1 Tax=Nocardioides jejuensis TaxID=2502782 RepID=A0A4R1CIV8_9ACTN|nr:DUF6226 family protein [Nocardioides jejuensis]TCJ30747.1 hypothetical protein EPD65_01545 [Nocardioides jejuensis]